MADNLLSHINYTTMVDHYDEMLVSNYWTMDFIEAPKAAYFPGTNFFKSRIQSISGIVEPEASVLDYTVRGYPTYQTGMTSVPSADLQLQFVDYEDSTVLFFGRNWRDIQHYWAEFIANRLEYCVAVIKLYRCNKAGQAVREYTARRAIFQSLNYPDDFSETSELIGYNCSINIKCLLLQQMNNYSIL